MLAIFNFFKYDLVDFFKNTTNAVLVVLLSFVILFAGAYAGGKLGVALTLIGVGIIFFVAGACLIHALTPKR